MNTPQDGEGYFKQLDASASSKEHTEMFHKMIVSNTPEPLPMLKNTNTSTYTNKSTKDMITLLRLLPKPKP